MKAIVGGIVLTPMKVIEDGVILVDNGRIKSVGKGVKIPEKAEVIDVKGKYVTPGFVDGHSHIGMVPDGVDWEDTDVNDFYGPITPQLRAIDSLNLFDTAFSESLADGVTTVYTGPGSSNPIGGTGSIVKTHGRTTEDMIVREFASVKMALGPKRTREDMRPKMPYPTTRMGTVAIVRAALLRAREYMEGRLDPERLDGEETLMLKILSELLKGKVPAHIHTSNMPDEIFSVIRIVDEFKIRATMDHGFGSELVAERVAESKIPVIYGPMMMARKSAGLKYVSDRTPGILTSKGVMTSIMTDHPVIPEKYLRLSAAVAVKNGMEPTEALKAITINPAQAIGISEKLGSIELGKDADLVVMSDKPLKVRSVVEMVLVNGEVVYQKQ